MADRGLYEASILDMRSIRRHAKHVARTTPRTPTDGMHEFVSHTEKEEDNRPWDKILHTIWHKNTYFVTIDGDFVHVSKMQRELLNAGTYSEETKITDPEPMSEREILDLDYQWYRRALWAPFKGFGLITNLNALLPDAKGLEAKADAGNATAMLECAQREFYGIGRLYDFQKAATWFQKAAAQGDPRAMGGLAECYIYGCGISPDYSRARKWFQLAADSGDSYSKVVIENDCDLTNTGSYLEYHWKNVQ